MTQATDFQKFSNIEDGLKELGENLEKGVDIQIGIFVKDIAGTFESRARDEVLKGVLVFLDSHPKNLTRELSQIYERHLNLRLFCCCKWKARINRNVCLEPGRNRSKILSRDFFPTQILNKTRSGLTGFLVRERARWLRPSLGTPRYKLSLFLTYSSSARIRVDTTSSTSLPTG